MKDFLERVRYKTIILEEDERGRAAGQVGIEWLRISVQFLYQAWVELDSRDEMDRALDLHRKHLGSRFCPFVDIFYYYHSLCSFHRSLLVIIVAFLGTSRCLRPIPATWSVLGASSEQVVLEGEEEVTGAATGTTGGAGLSKLWPLVIVHGFQVAGLCCETQWAAVPCQRA